jgi:hypothetical protein
VKKLVPTKAHPKPGYITRAEFLEEQIATRDRIGASYLALADKLDANHRDLLTALERQGANFDRILSQQVERPQLRTKAETTLTNIEPVGTR